ncbi:hypothetical protein M2152_000664 [Microbacteriaceae bacterium SG_E_30_P1]|uniref:Uncharacterized protein n=1 Tax=Antiquaquibacter oligotrophicus TaxID=2880260 RepID=A0ABT6KMW8_9MICO|nr:hypothetical protein [Antiquaquibacter oligotrophicus]MDH6180482.1 hypothetical protein [Antiquaquibacter oligotrophicus]UDF13781.1 hypothetical protein LH407_02695 [Antiquaquibacter oligotrophicus]
MTEWVPLEGSKRVAQLSRGAATFVDVLLLPFTLPFQLIAWLFAEGGAVEVDLDTFRLRRGRRIVDVQDVDRARRLDDDGTAWLRLSARERFEFLVPLSGEERMPALTRATLLTIIPKTSIALPDNPFGSSRRAFPDYLTRDEVVDLVSRLH